MGFLGESGVTALWSKIKATFGRSLETSGTTINLKNAAATPGTLSQVTLSAGNNVTLTGNDSTKTITIEAADTTYSAATTSAAGLMSASDKSKLDGIATGANAYTHPTTSGNKHIPAGGSSGQILRWSADGTAAWGADTDTTYSEATTSAAGLLSASDKEKLDGIEAGAQVNQSAFTAVDADGTTISADAAGNTLNLTAGKNVSISASKTSITIDADDTTYSAATTSAAGLMSAADKTKLDGITADADTVSFTQSLTSGTKVGTLTVNGTGVDLYAPTDTDTHYTSMNVVGKTTATSNTTSSLANGAVYLNSVENGAVTSSHLIKGTGATTVKSDTKGNIVINSTNTTYSAATTSAAGLMSAADKTKLDGIAESAVSIDDVNTAIASAQVGAAMYQGSVSSNDTISGSEYKAGWYWVVGTAGTYVGETCEVGDMIFANTDKGSAYSTAHFDVIQNNIVEMTASEVEAVCTL